MLYLCEVCGYKTNRLLNFKRHEARKTPCKNKNEQVIMINSNNADGGNVNVSGGNVNVSGENVNVSGENVNADGGNVNANSKKHICFKCNKEFKRSIDCKKHTDSCDGTNSLQCKICLKVFVTRQGKHQHIQYVKCKPPPQQNNIGTVNNNNNNNTIINRMPFGKENLEEMFNDTEYMKKILFHITEGGKYSLVR